MPDTYPNAAIGEDALKAIKAWVKEQVLGGGINAYPIGSIYMSVNPTSPADIFGGTWEALDQGRVLIGAGASHPAGEVGGEETHVLATSEMPSHNHTESSAGSHTHSGSTGSGGSHSHSRGTMNITGSVASNQGTSFSIIRGVASEIDEEGAMGIVSINTNKGIEDFNGSTVARVIGFDFDASRSGAWTGSTSSSGNHSHTLSSISSSGSHSHTINNTGGNEAHNNMQPYLSVYMWKRTA